MSDHNLQSETRQTDGLSSALIGKWRITEADLWDREYLDLVEPAYIAFQDNGYGEFAFGCVTGTGECEYSSRILFFIPLSPQNPKILV